MRLIDADSFISDLGNCKGTAIDNIRKMVENYPTAYDVDRVAEKIEQYIANDPCNVNGACPWEENTGISCAICGAMGALKIVKNEA